MTINVGLITNDSLVLGCDSIASASSPLLNPFRDNLETLESGRLRLEFDFSDLENTVTEAWGGVTKMFELCGPPVPVAATTSGLAKLSERPMSSLAEEFRDLQAGSKRPRVNVRAVANDFLRFMRTKYKKHYSGSPLPEELRSGPHFLVGGFGRDDDHPSLFRVNVQASTSDLQFESRAGVAWAGQSDAVERLLRGIDSRLSTQIEAAIRLGLLGMKEKMEEALVANVQQVLDLLKASLPEGHSFSMPSIDPVDLPLDGGRLLVDYGNMPLQSAVDFAAFLVNLQSGRSKFGSGVPTVGGRTHIGVITKAGGFKMLNEPELEHTSTGFSSDL